MRTAAEGGEEERAAVPASGLPTFTCKKCGKKFEVGDWDCKDGKMHEVAPKTYYSPVSSWRTYVAEERIITISNGQTRMTPARAVDFVRGVYTTSNPEDQYALDNKEGLISAEDWRERFISQEERNKMKQRELELREKRLVEREQALLAKIKSQTGGDAA